MEDKKQCTKCGKTKPLTEFYKNGGGGLRSYCKECGGAYSHQYYVRHREERAAYNYQYRAEHAEERAEYSRQYYETHAEEARARSRRRRRENPEKVAEYNHQYHAEHSAERAESDRRYCEANPEKIREKGRRYREAYPERIRERNRRWRARRANAEGSFSEAEFKALCEKYGWRCLCCGKAHKVASLVPDHVISLSKGGSNNISNIQPLCSRCNSSKGAKCTDYRKPAPGSRTGSADDGPQSERN